MKDTPWIDDPNSATMKEKGIVKGLIAVDYESGHINHEYCNEDDLKAAEELVLDPSEQNISHSFWGQDAGW